MSNLLHTLDELVVEKVASSLSANLAENKNKLLKGMQIANHTIVHSLSKVSNSSATFLQEILYQAGNHENFVNELLDNLNSKTSFLPLQQGLAFKNIVLGNKSIGVENIVSNALKFSPSATSHVFQYCAAILANQLGKKMIADKLSLHDLQVTLQQYQHNNSDNIPVVLTKYLENSIDTLNPKLKNNMQETSTNKTNNSFRWLLPIILIGLLGIAIWYGAMSYFGNKVNSETSNEVIETASNSIDHAANQASDNLNQSTTLNDSSSFKVNGKVDDAGNWIAAKGEAIKLKLANGKEIDAFKNGLEDKLYNFIQDPSALASNEVWFDFQDLLFESGKSTLKKTSIVQLDNVCEILNAYPKIKIKIGGYTDNSGDSANNLTLSHNRAKTVYNLMLNKGVNKTSFVEPKPFEGFGIEFPVADNNTVEGKAQNRRIAISIRAK